MEIEYIPEPNDKVKWWASQKSRGTVKGIVDYVLPDEQAAMCYVPVSPSARFAGGSRPRYKKRFDQLILVERPES